MNRDGLRSLSSNGRAYRQSGENLLAVLSAEAELSSHSLASSDGAQRKLAAPRPRGTVPDPQGIGSGPDISIANGTRSPAGARGR